MAIILTPKDGAINVSDVNGDSHVFLGTLVQTNVEWADVKATHPDGTELRFLWSNDVVLDAELSDAINTFMESKIWDHVENGTVVPTAKEERQYHVEEIGKGVYQVTNLKGESVTFDDSEWVPSVEHPNWVFALLACETCGDGEPTPMFCSIPTHNLETVGDAFSDQVRSFHQAMVRYRDVEMSDEVARAPAGFSGIFAPLGKTEPHRHYSVAFAAGPGVLTMTAIGDDVGVDITIDGKLVFRLAPDCISSMGRFLYPGDDTSRDTMSVPGKFLVALSERTNTIGTFTLDEITPEKFSNYALGSFFHYVTGPDGVGEPLTHYTEHQQAVLKRSISSVGCAQYNNAWIAVLLRAYLLVPFSDREHLVSLAMGMLEEINESLTDEWRERMPALLTAIIRNW